MARKSKNKSDQTPLDRLLADPRVRRIDVEGQELFEATSVVAALARTQMPDEQWEHLKLREPALDRAAVRVPGVDVDALDLRGVVQLAMAIDSPRAQRIKKWIADAAASRMSETHDPELAFLRAQKLYRRRGYPRRWVDRRLRSVSSRRELVSEWYRRGARDSEQFRALTNALMQAAFGMDVNAFRQHKGLVRPTDKLRDHLNDLELSLLSLAELAALSLTRDRNSTSLEQLTKDARDAGAVIRCAREQIEDWSRDARRANSPNTSKPSNSRSGQAA